MSGIALGILSDSHGQRTRVRTAIALLQSRGVTRFVHLGDFGDGVLDELAGLDVCVVFGNCDDPRSLDRDARELGLSVMHPSGVIECDGKRIGITHGHLVEELERLFLQRVDYLLHGHSHQRSDAIVDGVRMINPGALHRAKPFTVALFIPATGYLESMTLV